MYHFEVPLQIYMKFENLKRLILESIDESPDESNRLRRTAGSTLSAVKIIPAELKKCGTRDLQ
jgi:hypothetical protein